ncbi:MAG: efflux RND transporter periplasmic adaptor subunit [Verrucomicrobiota bacterium]
MKNPVPEGAERVFSIVSARCGIIVFLASFASMDEKTENDPRETDAVSESLKSLQIDRSSPSKPRPWFFATIVIALVVLLGWFGRSLLPEKSAVESERSISSETELSPVATAEEPSPKPVASRWTVSGYLVARRESLVSAEITAKVAELLVREGQRVEEGEIVALLDAELAEADLRIAELQVEAAAHEITAIKAELDEAETFLDRTKKISGTGATSESALNKAESRFATLSARYFQAKAKEETALGVAKRAEVVLSKHVIRAPFSGVVTDCAVEVGETISIMSSSGTSTGGICTIIDPLSIEVELDLPEKLIGRVEVGMLAKVILDAHPDTIFEAQVKSIAPTANREKATILTWLEFLEFDPRFRPDMAAKVDLEPVSDSKTK